MENHFPARDVRSLFHFALEAIKATLARRKAWANYEDNSRGELALFSQFPRSVLNEAFCPSVCAMSGPQLPEVTASEIASAVVRHHCRLDNRLSHEHVFHEFAPYVFSVLIYFIYRELSIKS